MPIFAREKVWRWLPWAAVGAVVLYLLSPTLLRSAARHGDDAANKDKGPPPSSYDQVSPVLLGQQTFEKMLADDKANREKVMARQKAFLEERYDLSRRVDENVKMSRGKPIAVGPTTKLPEGTTWDKLAEMSPDEVKEKGCSRKGSCP